MQKTVDVKEWRVRGTRTSMCEHHLSATDATEQIRQTRPTRGNKGAQAFPTSSGQSKQVLSVTLMGDQKQTPVLLCVLLLLVQSSLQRNLRRFSVHDSFEPMGFVPKQLSAEYLPSSTCQGDSPTFVVVSCCLGFHQSLKQRVPDHNH